MLASIVFDVCLITKHQYHCNHILCLIQDGPASKCCICAIEGPLFHSKVSRFMTIHFMAIQMEDSFLNPTRHTPEVLRQLLHTRAKISGLISQAEHGWSHISIQTCPDL